MSIEQYLLDQANLETIAEQDDKIRELENEILRLREGNKELEGLLERATPYLQVLYESLKRY